MTVLDTAQPLKVSRRRNIELVSSAVHRHSLFFHVLASTRAFTLAFSSLVYPQIWEDPEVDMEAHGVGAGSPHRHDRIRRLQSSVLPHRCAAPDHRRRSEFRARGTEPAEARGSSRISTTPISTACSARGREGEHRGVRRILCSISTPRQGTTGRPGPGADAAGSRLYPRLLPPWTARPLHCRWPPAGPLSRRESQGPAGGAIPRRPAHDLRPRAYAAVGRPIVRNILDRRSSLFGLGIPPAQYDALSEGRPMHEVARTPRAAGLRLCAAGELLRMAGVQPRLRPGDSLPVPRIWRRHISTISRPAPAACRSRTSR